MNFLAIAPYGSLNMGSQIAFIRRMLRTMVVTLLVAGSNVSLSQIDLNTNGISDLWEASYGNDLDEGADSDGDGFTNSEEARSGSDPHDASNYPRSSLFSVVTGDRAFVQFPTVPGIHYQVEASTNLSTWLPYGSPVAGDGAIRTLDIDMRQAFSPGGVSASVWTGLTGYGVALIRNYATNTAFPPHVMRSIDLLEYLQSSPNQEQFGTSIQGWLIPPASGSYTFWIASDDSSEMWLSTNSTPGAKMLIASVNGWTGFREWTKYPSQQSVLINLTSNQTYYFEVYHRESYGGDHLSVAWTRPGTAPGIREIIGTPHLTPSPGSLHEFAQGDSPLSLRLSVSQSDSDNDGLLDYEEAILGLNPELTNSTPRQPDLPEALRIIGSENSITIGATQPRAYESSGAPGTFTVYRGGNINPVTVQYTVTGSAIAGGDFIQPTSALTFATGKRLATIDITPVNDGIIETAEVVTITLLPGTNYSLGSPSTASVTIDDAPDVLYVAQLRPVNGITGGGSGLGSVRRAGNALSSMVNLSFNGLKAEEVAAEIVVSSNGITGITVNVLPMDQVALHPWNYQATNGLSREAIITALDEGNAWVRIKTTANPSGELIGQLIKSPGWYSMPAPVEPPLAPTSAGSLAEASRFLTQATFGPTMVDIAALTGTSYAAWIDSQQNLPPTYHLPYVQHRRAELYARDGSDGWQTPRQMAWWQHALTAPDQLRQRMAWALSQILVVSQFGALDGEHEGVTRYYDYLVEHAFGNYRDLLEDVTLSPMMGIYLSMMRNQKPDPDTGHEPDENYAREIMQLFTIGLTEMHNDGSYRLNAEGMPLPTYTQNDIVGLAHIFTGWSVHYDTTNPPRWSDDSVADPDDWFFWGWDSMRPMSFYGNRHDTLDRTIVGGVTISANTNGVDRMDQALDTLFNHPNMGPFIARQLIQRFVTSNPGPGYIHRVASVFNNNGSGVRGDLGATIKAVLLDYDARSPSMPAGSISYGKPVEPVMRLTRMLRAFPPVAPFATNGDHRLFVEFQWSMPEQVPQYASSVFNFYQPGYRQPGLIARSGLNSPEFQIYAETTAIREANLHYSAINWGIWTSEPLTTNSNVTLQLDLSPLVSILQTPGLTPAQAQELLIDRLDELLLFGNMSSSLRGNLESFFASLPTWYNYSESNQRQRARFALYLVLNSPEFLTQR